MRIQMNVKTGAITVGTNHNQTTAGVPRIKSCVKAGDWPVSVNHKQMFALGLKALALALLFTVWAGAASAQPYQVVHSETTAVTNNLTRTVTTVQAGGNPLNRFFMHRVTKNLPEPAFRGVILLLPPQGIEIDYEYDSKGIGANEFCESPANRGDGRRLVLSPFI